MFDGFGKIAYICIGILKLNSNGMKRTTRLWMLATCLAMVLGLASCSEEDNPAVSPDETSTENLADATIIWYGVGGGNTDKTILENFRQFYTAQPGSYDRVNIVAQYKASYKVDIYFDKSDEEIAQEGEEKAAGLTEEEIENLDSWGYLYVCHPKQGATYRFTLDPKKTLRKQLTETEPYGKMNADCTCPDSLTNFINWAAAHYPAKKYILVMADHGGGYMPHTDLADGKASTRALIFDDGYMDGDNKKCFSGKSFAQALRNANVRIDGIVLYLCLMNNLEFLYEVKDVTDYIACSTYILTGLGGALQTIIDNFAAGQDIETALGNFMDATMKSFDGFFYHPEDPEKPYYYDMTLTKTSKLDALAPLLKEFTDRLVDTYQNGTQAQRNNINIATRLAVKMQNIYPFYDMAKYMKTLFMTVPEVFDQDLYDRIKTAFNACIVKQSSCRYLSDHNYQVDYSVMLGKKGGYNLYLYGQKNMEPVLEGAYVYHPDGTIDQYKYNGEGAKNISFIEDYELTGTDTWPSTFADTYQYTTFDRLVGWSRWLLLNEEEPPSWSPNSFRYRLPGEDMSGIPII